MTGNSIRKLMSFLVGIIMIFSFAGCNILRPEPPKEESESKKNPPKALTQMEEDTDNMIQELEEVRDKRAKQEREKEHPSKEQPQQGQQEQQQGKQEQQGQNKEQQGQRNESQKDNKQQSGSQGQQQEQKQGEQQGKKEEPQKTEQPIPVPNWQELEAKVEKLHENWNTYEPKAKADGAMPETIKSFEEQLIALTEQIMARDEEKTLTAANSLYSHYPEFLKLYSHNQPPEVKEAKSLTRQILMYGQQHKWEETKPLLEKLKLAWQEAKTKMKKPDKELNAKIDAAVYDFNFVVTEKKINLAKIKGKILIKNLEQIK